MGAPQAGRHRSLIPRVGRSDDLEVGGQLEAVTQDAVQGGPHPLGPGSCVEHPRRQLERRIVTNVSPVETDELRHPVTGVILHESDDAALH